jgi:hypothetical protein
MRRSNELYLMIFKPHRFFDIQSFESDRVKTKWLVKINIDHIDCTDYPSESSEETIIGHTHPAAYGKYFYLKILISAFAYYFRRSRR